MGKIYKNDIGTRIILNAGTDISSNNVLRIEYFKPSGTTGYWTADEVVSDTKAQYTTVANDLDEAGLWGFRIYVELSSGWKGHGELYERRIYDPDDRE